MAYRDDILALGADHHWDFDGDSLDQIGSAHGTDTSIVYSDVAIAEDAAFCARTDAIGDRVTIPSTANINNSNQSRKAVAGWFLTTVVQDPPKRIYGEGASVQSFQFVMGWGNNIIFEVDDPSFTLQVFGDTFLESNRAYHLCMIFEGNGYGNEVRAYLDGVEQLSAEPSNRQPGAATLTARLSAEFGDPAGTVAVGGKTVILNAPVNGRWQHWATWDGVNAVMTDADVRDTLFEKGALPDVTIASGTEGVMQTALDALVSTVRSNAPLCIRVEALSGGGDLTLTANNITFDALASIHVQYMGVDTLTWRNTNGSDASIVSVPGAGTVILVEEQTLTVNVKDVVSSANIQNARVYIEADVGGDLAAGTVIMNVLTDASGIATTTFDYTNDQPIISRVRKGSTAPFYRTGQLQPTLTSTPLNTTVLLVGDG